VKSYVRNTINLSCAKVLLTSVIDQRNIYRPWETDLTASNTAAYGRVLRTTRNPSTSESPGDYRCQA